MTPLLLLLPFCLPQHGRPEPPSEFLDAAQEPGAVERESLLVPGEVHFGNFRRLSTLGEHAEGYFSWAGDRISMQATIPPYECDQIFTLDLLTGTRTLVSTGTGRTTCAYFYPGDDKVIFASTHAADPGCLPPPDFSKGYVWKIFPQFEIYVRDLNSGELSVLAPHEGYDAEATVSPRGDKVVFTSTRNGDLDIYTMNLDGSDVLQLTDQLGYDGGPFYSPDGSKIVYRAFYPKTEAETARYRELLAIDTIEPMALQLMVMDADGKNKRQITDNGCANFAPYYHPDGKRIIFCSNYPEPRGHDFNLFLIGEDGKNMEQVTHYPGFDGFPMFSHDGKRLIFASNRKNAHPGNTNLFLVDWIE